MWFAKIADGFRGFFRVQAPNGTLRAGIVPADFTVTVVDPVNATSTFPAVTESVLKGGLYFFDISPVFLAAGIGEYGVTVEVDTSSPPKVKATFGMTLKVNTQGFEDVGAGATPAAIAAAVWDTLRASHVVAGSFGEALTQSVATAEANILATIGALNDLGNADVDAAITANAVIVFLRKVLTNRRETNPSTGKLDIYNDADTVVEFSIDIFEDVAATQAYQGAGIDRQNKIV